MKFRCSSNDLLSALQVAIRALSVRSPQPILEGVLIEALDDEVRLTASDGTFTIITTLPAAVEDEGDAVMPGRLFNEVVRKMPSPCAVSAPARTSPARTPTRIRAWRSPRTTRTSSFRRAL